jgi:hypothetical protein|tara:strand:- start:144 stop:461 length:318 start_codon:yes stop_codon:yes gene_type:complete
MRYLANFRHDIKSMELANKVTTETKEAFNMRCQQTMVGFVQKANGGDKTKQTSIQCFYGVLDSSTKESDKLKSKLDKAEFVDKKSNSTGDSTDKAMNADKSKLKI